MSNKQMQGVAGNGRKVNKKLQVPSTVPYVSMLFKDFVQHYQGTIFEEGEDAEALYERMRSWHKVLRVDCGFSGEVLTAMIEHFKSLPSSPRYAGGPCRTVRVPNLDDVIAVCNEKRSAFSKPRDSQAVNEQRQKIRLMMKGEQVA